MANPSLAPFRNEPFTDFSTAENKRAMQDALARARAELGHTYDLTIGGSYLQTPETFKSVNPANPSEIIGIHYAATAKEANEAVEAAQTAFATWRKVPTGERVDLLVRAANLNFESRFHRQLVDFALHQLLQLARGFITLPRQPPRGC